MTTRSIWCTCLSLISVVGLRAQYEPYIISQQGFVSIEPVYQYWSLQDQYNLTQVGSVLYLYAPLSREMSFSARGIPSHTGGDVPALSGFSDAQLGFAYHLEGPGVVLTLGVNLPTGKKELTQDEFQTSVLVSNTIFGLQVPNLGQGFGVNPGLLWAHPLSEDVVIGAGAGYYYKGKFNPLQGFKEYDPGDEITANAGLDIRADESSTLSADVIFTHYSNDKLDGEDYFSSGSRIVANLQYVRSFEKDELSILARFRTKGKNSAVVGGLLIPDQEKLDPDQWELHAQYHLRASEDIGVRFFAEGKFYPETPATFSGVHMGGIGVSPELSASPSILLQARVHFQYGTLKDGSALTGIDTGIGMKVKF